MKARTATPHRERGEGQEAEQPGRDEQVADQVAARGVARADARPARSAPSAGSRSPSPGTTWPMLGSWRSRLGLARTRRASRRHRCARDSAAPRYRWHCAGWRRASCRNERRPPCRADACRGRTGSTSWGSVDVLDELGLRRRIGRRHRLRRPSRSASGTSNISTCAGVSSGAIAFCILRRDRHAALAEQDLVRLDRVRDEVDEHRGFLGLLRLRRDRDELRRLEVVLADFVPSFGRGSGCSRSLRSSPPAAVHTATIWLLQMYSIAALPADERRQPPRWCPVAAGDLVLAARDRRWPSGGGAACLK